MLPTSKRRPSFGATALSMFGAAARDEMTEASDVDVFIDDDQDGSYTFVEWIQFSEYLQEILQRKADFTSRDGLHKRLRDEIIRSAVQVF